MSRPPQHSTTPAVSVVIACYNGAEFLIDALESIARQTLTNLECLVVDDASTDNSAALAEEFASTDSRFSVIRLPRNGGLSVARNAGLSQAKGEWITVLDADDLFLPERLETLCSLGERMHADLVVDDILISAFPSTKPLHRAFGFSGPDRPYTQEEYFRESRVFTRKLASGYMQPLVRREFLERSGCRYDPDVRSGPDFLLSGQLFALRPTCYVTSYAGYLYRRRKGSLSKAGKHLGCHAELTDKLLDSHGSNLSAISRDALIRRKRDFELLGNAIPLMTDVREGKWLGAAKKVAADPRTFITGLRLLARRSMRMLFSAVEARARPDQS